MWKKKVSKTEVEEASEATTTWSPPTPPSTVAVAIGAFLQK
jgi:hypothetical protein